MTERTQMIREKLNAPEALIEAVAKGEPYRRSSRSGERKSRHVKRITAAIAVYVCAALLIVGVAMLLPDILDQQPAHTQPTPTTPPPVSEPSGTTEPPETTEPPVTTEPPEIVIDPETIDPNNPLVGWLSESQPAYYTQIGIQYCYQVDGKQYIGGGVVADPYSNLEKVEKIVELLKSIPMSRSAEDGDPTDGEMIMVGLSDLHPTRDKIGCLFTLQGQYLYFINYVGSDVCYIISQSDSDRLAALLTDDYGMGNSDDLLADLLEEDAVYGGLKALTLEDWYYGLPRQHFDLVVNLCAHLSASERTLVDWRTATRQGLLADPNAVPSITFYYPTVATATGHESRDPLTVKRYGTYLQVYNYEQVQWYKLSQEDADRLADLIDILSDTVT